ncbi:hypothetical protein CVT25_012175 [Psilocybe cyanescens]|uniref:Uncharacterized protein n=1 Tax=Psilocybe cyanescens TaxID=93625 RepID=A0A409XFF2_PSICY|nr:hypothetical protein CVT25_012175 [Psilocybe cyanescens]
MSVRMVGARISIRKQVFQRRNYSIVKSSRPRILPSKAFLGGLVGGFAGVGSIVLTGYAYYHYSGAKKVVDNVQPAMAWLGQTRENLAKDAPAQALKYLREAAKAYVGSIPFAGFLLDKAFDAIGDVVQPHSEEANAIIWRAYEDISTIIQEKGNEHRTDGAWRIVSVTRRLLNELTALGLKAGQPLSDKLELERRAANAGARASAMYQAVKSSTPSVVENMKEKVKSMVLLQPTPNPGPEVSSSEKTSQETIQKIDEIR